MSAPEGKPLESPFASIVLSTPNEPWKTSDLDSSAIVILWASCCEALQRMLQARYLIISYISQFSPLALRGRHGLYVALSCTPPGKSSQPLLPIT